MMIEMIEQITENIPARAATKNGLELDAVEHAKALKWRDGERAAIKRTMNRRHRRHTRAALRLALTY